jgi:hypothetical protein
MSGASSSGGESETLEQDGRFPSGPWKGYFLQPLLKAGRSWMELQLTFQAGFMRGQGRDWVGPFVIVGRYQVDDGKCHWSKRYIGKHDVAYQGYNEGRGIWGGWEIPPLSHGGFHIWPVAMGDPDIRELAESLEEPALAGVAEEGSRESAVGSRDQKPAMV